PLGRIMVMDPLKVRLRLVEQDISKVRIGMEVRIRLDAFPGRVFKGRVSRIAPYLDPATRTDTVEVTLPNPRDPDTGRWVAKPGMYGVAQMVVGRRDNSMVAPEGALLLDNRLLARQKHGEKLRKAFVVDSDGVAHVRTVSVGGRKGDLYEVLSGLSDDDRVVIRGQHGLKDGQKVEIQPDAATGDSAQPPTSGGKTR
ncbi:MAG: efflux RND transporter periplasmic adaptor subunit, partial [Deltaproteobacteria bacterium]|nr:efflux RND transporter periplasmic adaptor subunit [Deltaproteobacteria bacterium]